MYGQIAKSAREKAGFRNRSEAARRLGVSGEALRKIETGTSIPKNSTMDSMVEVYEMGEQATQRLRRSVFLARKSRTQAVMEQEELKSGIDDLGSAQLSSEITKNVMALMREHRQIGERRLFREVNEIVKDALRNWRGR